MVIAKYYDKYYDFFQLDILSMAVFDLSHANRLLENLVQKEKEYQTLLRQSLEQKTQELHLLRLKLKSEGMRRYFESGTHRYWIVCLFKEPVTSSFRSLKSTTFSLVLRCINTFVFC